MALFPGKAPGVRPSVPGSGAGPGAATIAPPPARPANGADGGAAAVADRPPVAGNGDGAAAAAPPQEFTALEVTEMPVDKEDTDFDDELLRLTRKIHGVLVDELGGQTFKSDDRDKLRPVAQQVMNDVLKDEKPIMPKRKAVLLEEVLNEVLGYGPLEYLFAQSDISEVMINSAKDIFIERKGKICRSKRKFEDDRHLYNVIDRIVRPLGKQCNARSPIVDGRLTEGPAAGSRVNIIIPPLARFGPSLSIRKFFKKKLEGESLVQFGSMTDAMLMFLEAAVKARMNIIIAGGTGSGKTTTLNVTSNFIPQDERVVTIEDAAELQVYIPNLVSLESRPANIEGEGEVTIRDLVKNALRMRPERIIVGECRGGETLDMLQAMNTGHDGSLSTVHSNTPRDTISRLQTLCMMSDTELPLLVVSKQISSAIQLIVQQARLSDGSRKITHITEVQGMEGDTILLSDIFIYDGKRGPDGKYVGRHRATGMRPKCVPSIEAAGYKLPRDLFQPD